MFKAISQEGFASIARATEQRRLDRERGLADARDWRRRMNEAWTEAEWPADEKQPRKSTSNVS